MSRSRGSPACTGLTLLRPSLPLGAHLHPDRAAVFFSIQSYICFYPAVIRLHPPTCDLPAQFQHFNTPWVFGFPTFIGLVVRASCSFFFWRRFILHARPLFPWHLIFFLQQRTPTGVVQKGPRGRQPKRGIFTVKGPFTSELRNIRSELPPTVRGDRLDTQRVG